MEGDSIQLLEWVRIFINTWVLECDHEAISTEFEVPTHECAVHHDKVNKKSHHGRAPVQFAQHCYFVFVKVSTRRPSNNCRRWHFVTRFAWWWQDLDAIELLRAHIGEWTMTWMLDYWRVMCFTGYRLNWNPCMDLDTFPVDSDCTLLCAQVDKTTYSSI
jgi:hypothetical protein